jgi:hypothetical protein
MLEALITSKTKLKLLLKFFLNTSNTGYLRGLAAEFNESTNSVRLELNKLEEAGLLDSQTEGPRKVFRANPNHPLFTDIQSIVRKYIGIDEIIQRVISLSGNPSRLYLIGNLALGRDSEQINLIIIGEQLDTDYLQQLITKAQKLVTRKIGFLALTPLEFQQQIPQLNPEKLLLVWQNDELLTEKSPKDKPGVKSE